MIYVDTSAFVPLFIREPKSELIIGWLESSSELLAISAWTLVEFASATAIKVRTAQTAASVAKKATTRATEFARNHCTVAIPGRDEYQQAADLAGSPALKLRAGDALHLAIASRLNVETILCLDEDMLESARALGLKTLTF